MLKKKTLYEIYLNTSNLLFGKESGVVHTLGLLPFCFLFRFCNQESNAI